MSNISIPEYEIDSALESYITYVPVPFVGPRFAALLGGKSSFGVWEVHIYDRWHIDFEGYPLVAYAYGDTLDGAIQDAITAIDFLVEVV